ncbi:MAG: hypothetical protein HDR88_06805 [Bacteroides sp.]|nr:hypothetical protein [Bacteroides sp.]
MKNLLFPTWVKRLGWILFIPAIIMAIFCYFGVAPFHGIVETIIIDATLIGIALGAMFIVCSKEPVEDEMIRSIRLASLLSSLYVYVIILIVGILSFNGPAFLMFALVNMVLFPIIYVIRFRLEIYRYNKMSEDEE